VGALGWGAAAPPRLDVRRRVPFPAGRGDGGRLRPVHGEPPGAVAVDRVLRGGHDLHGRCPGAGTGAVTRPGRGPKLTRWARAAMAFGVLASGCTHGLGPPAAPPPPAPPPPAPARPPPLPPP